MNNNSPSIEQVRTTAPGALKGRHSSRARTRKYKRRLTEAELDEIEKDRSLVLAQIDQQQDPAIRLKQLKAIQSGDWQWRDGLARLNALTEETS